MDPSLHVDENTCLGSQHLYDARAANAAGFRDMPVINRHVYRRVFKFFSVRRIPTPLRPHIFVFNCA